MTKPLLPLTLILALALASCSSGEEAVTTSTGPPTSSTAMSESAASMAPGSESAANLSPTAVVIRTTRGTVEPAPVRREFVKGETVQIVITSDVSEEVHVHGYDKSLKLMPEVTGTLEFVADIPGVFEVELEQSGKQLFELAIVG